MLMLNRPPKLVLELLSRIYNIRIISCVFLVAFSFTISAARASSADQAISLSTAMQRSLSQNPSLKFFPYRIDALKGQMEAAKLSPAYELGFDTDNIGGTGNYNGISGAEFTIALSSVFEMDNKRLARIGTVSSELSLLEASRQVESLALLGDVTRRYVDVLAAQEQVVLAQEATQLSIDTLDIVKKRAAAGATPDAEVKRALAALEQARLSLFAEQQRLSYLKVSLSSLWGSSSPDFENVEGNLFQFGEDISFEQLFERVKLNPAIEIFASEARLKDAEIRVAKTQSKSDISWSVGVRRTQDTNDTALVAGFSMPLFSGSRNQGAISTAIAEKNQVFVKRDVMLLDMHNQLFRAFYNRKQAILVVNSLRSTIIPSLEQALIETQDAYQRGRYGYLDYVSSRQELLSARRTLIEAAASALTYGAEIEQLTSEPLASSQYNENIKLSGISQ
ncbi:MULTISPECIES: TolC family protein [Shewanella]|uniref:TolC family protein n=2 Tax=Shewanellaceae TaxID=267890 RepID=UPI003AAA6C61